MRGKSLARRHGAVNTEGGMLLRLAGREWVTTARPTHCPSCDKRNGSLNLRHRASSI